MQTVKQHILRAAKIMGGQKQLALAIGVKPPMITNMLNGKPVPPKRSTLIEQVTCGKVTRKQLRPDDWRELWPELIGRR